MKKILLLSMLFSALALMSCKDDSPAMEYTSELTFNVAAPAPAENPTKVAAITRYILEVYQTSDLTTVLHRIEQAGGTFTVPLANNISYTCLFWADETALDDNANGVFNALDLKNVTLNAGKVMEDAFFARLDIANDEHTFNITLKRPTAKINIVENTSIVVGSTVVVTHNHYNGFNALTSDVVGAAVSRASTITAAVTSGNIGSYLTFASIVGTTTNFTSVFNSTITNTIPNVPLKANFITNIKGHYPGGDQNFTFSINIADQWAEVVEGIDINLGSTQAPSWLRVADRNAEKGGVNGATSGNTATDYGYYYQWSSASQDAANKDMSYSACYNFGEGDGRWRMPTSLEIGLMMSRSVYVGGELRLVNERPDNTNYVVIPLSAFRSGADGFGTIPTNAVDLGNIANYWSSTVEPNSTPLKASRYHIDATDPLSVVRSPDFEFSTFGFSVRCVRSL